MIISISLVVLLVGIVCVLIALGRLSILGALTSVLLGFYAAGTAIAPPLKSATGTCLDVLSQIATHIA